MANHPTPFITIESKAAGRFQSSDKLPTINILLYTDDPLVTAGLENNRGLGTMLAHLDAHPPAFARLCFELINRDAAPEQKLYLPLIRKYDQIWFFGVQQISRQNPTLGILRGGPDSELDEKEVEALYHWMKVGEDSDCKGGGVLMTGDHANERPEDAINVQHAHCPPSSGTEKFLGLGRALGRCVPRAGQLRRWEGPPTWHTSNSFNTLVLSTGTDVEEVGLQEDPVPQQLILQTFDDKGQPMPGGSPHPLFYYRPGRSIQVFPDHQHEGAVVLPKEHELTEPMWPKVGGVPLKPQVVAHGIDKRNAQLLKLVAAYNGDRAGVGRIVADSTWHHYFNINLNMFVPPGDEGSPTNQIGQFYSNLALWLIPIKTRYQMACAMVHMLAHHPNIQEVGIGYNQKPGSLQKWEEAITLGREAFNLISQVASPCEIHELFQVFTPTPYLELFETLQFPDRAFVLSQLPSKEMLLGYLINSYRLKMAKIESSKRVSFNRSQVLDDAVADGFREAIYMQGKRLELTVAAARDFINLTKRRRKGDGILRQHNMEHEAKAE